MRILIFDLVHGNLKNGYKKIGFQNLLHAIAKNSFVQEIVTNID